MRLFLLLIGIVLYMNTPGNAQDTIMCKVVVGPDSIKKVTLNGVKYDLYDAAALKKIINLKTTKDSLKREVDAKDKLLAALNTIPEQCTTAVTAKNEYIASVTDMMLQYKQMYKDARKLSSAANSKLSIEAAVGVSGADGINPGKMSKPVLLAGIGLWKFRTYLLLQEKNAGILIGGSFRLF